MSYGTTCLDFMADDVVVPIDTWREEAFEALLSQGRSSGLASAVVSSGIPVTRGLSSILGSGGVMADGVLAAAGLMIGTVPSLFSPASNQNRDKEIVLPDKTGRTLVQKCGFPRSLYEEFETIAVLEKKLGARQSYAPILRNIATYIESISRFFLLHHLLHHYYHFRCSTALLLLQRLHLLHHFLVALEAVLCALLICHTSFFHAHIYFGNLIEHFLFL